MNILIELNVSEPYSKVQVLLDATCFARRLLCLQEDGGDTRWQAATPGDRYLELAKAVEGP